MSAPALSRLGLVPWYGIGLLIALCLKWFYSRAGPDDLTWILGPTTWLAASVSGMEFERELRYGWISHEHRMIVGSGCAGLNFMTIAFSTFYFAFLHRVGRGARRAAWLAASIVAAYLLTVATNAIRVLVTTSLYGMDIYGPQVTPRRLHALAGVSIYATSLVLAVLVAGRLIDGSGPRSRRVLAALGTYLAFVIAVPLATRAGLDDPRRFIEHSAMAVTVCALLAAAAGARRRRRRDSGRPLG